MDKEYTVLIVDDRAPERETLEVLLAPEGYRLAFAADGHEALDRAAQLTPDLILLDVMMPGMDGFEVCRQLRSDPVHGEVPVVLVTALDDRSSRISGIEAGADDFISKPFDRNELRARVRTLTKLNRYRRLLLERTKLAWVMEHTEAGYVIIDEHDRLEYANAQARLFLSLPAVAPEHSSDPDPPERSFLELVRRQYHLNPEEAWRHWPETSTSTGSDAPLRYLVRPESATANATWLQVMTLDIPARPVTKRLIRLRDVTSEINKRLDLGSFHSVISHKVRTPINGILGTLRVLADEDSGLEPAQMASLAGLAIESAERLEQELLEVLQFLEMSDTLRTGDRFALDRFEPLVREIAERLQPGATALSVSGLHELGHSRVVLSVQGMELILTEILTNAIKFHPQQSPAIEISAAAVDSSIRIRICDDGISLSPAQLSEVWGPYHQAEKWFTGQVPGMGLGLPLVALLVWSCGGTCHICNREGSSGVVVELSIPLATGTEG
jgi:DNA-binding response OmpR family regulator/two-component sensor histidine kinase